MAIQLSPALEERLAREAEARGIQPKDIVEEALDAYWKPRVFVSFQESDDWKRLRELTRKYKKRSVDFESAVRRAKARAYQLYEDNIENIELAAKRYAKSANNDNP